MFAGLSVSLVLLASCVLIGRYAWILYGGRFTAKTDTELFQTPDVEKAGLEGSKTVQAADTESLSGQQAKNGTPEPGCEREYEGEPKRDHD